MEKDYKEQLKSVCKKYNFKYVEYSENKIALCAKDTDRHWSDWIKLDLKNKDVTLVGNTDNCNFWFCDTRKDMTPEKIIEFVADLNTMLRKFNNSYISVKSLIDPEDWQEVAKVQDAYEDNRYKIQFEEIVFGSDNYIYFSILKEEYLFNGLFRIHDPSNGNDMTLVSISDCEKKKDQDFFNAHWEEIENELCERAIERQISDVIEKINSSNNSHLFKGIANCVLDELKDDMKKGKISEYLKVDYDSVINITERILDDEYFIESVSSCICYAIDMKESELENMQESEKSL
ncbi:MAG: hypothetical protein HFJ60_04040 [Clostridia bacterium]|jgi:hypothetical protein|nr:hypothetical protein [Clostridia bacterium]